MNHAKRRTLGSAKSAQVFYDGRFVPDQNHFPGAGPA
jgi:hypothetical protein